MNLGDQQNVSDTASDALCIPSGSDDDKKDATRCRHVEFILDRNMYNPPFRWDEIF